MNTKKHQLNYITHGYSLNNTGILSSISPLPSMLGDLECLGKEPFEAGLIWEKIIPIL